MVSSPSVAGAPRPRTQTRLRKLSRGIKRNRHVLLLLAPAMGLIATFYVAPTVVNLSYGFTDWSTYHTAIHWIGLDNFRALSTDGTIWSDLWTTIKYAVLVTVFMNAFALALALALERTSRLNSLFRSLFFLPVLVSSLAAGFLWSGIVSDGGTLNQILGVILLHPVHTQWFANGTLSLIIVALIHSWRFGGILMLVYIAALNAVPEDLIEAAKVEGASNWRIIRKIKLPLIGPAFTFNVTVSLITALSIFDLIFATTSGGPARATEVLNIYVWQQYASGAFGYATAVSLVLFLVIVLTAFPLVAYLRRREVDL
jgi:raffinose/stachyose/melibiose transport system permease protein